MKSNKKVCIVLIALIIASTLALGTIPMLAMAQTSTLTDSSGKVSISIPSDSNAIIPEGAQLTVTDIPQSEMSDQIYGEIAKAVYGAPTILAYCDASLSFDGAPVSLQGPVIVTVTVSADVTNFERIYFVTIDNDGKVTAHPTGINEDGTVYYMPESISRFAVVGIGEGVNEGPSAGTIVGLIVGGAFIIAVAGLAFSWFVIYKKTWADLVAIFKKKR